MVGARHYIERNGKGAERGKRGRYEDEEECRARGRRISPGSCKKLRPQICGGKQKQFWAFLHLGSPHLVIPTP